MGNIADIYGGEFDTDRPDAATGFDALPAGWYPVEIEKAEIKTTKAGTGKYLHLEMTVLGSEQGFGGRKLFPNINLMNPNPKAVEIGQRELAALGQACGLGAITDSDELLGHQIEARVKVEQQEGYGDGNRVTAYRAIGGATAKRDAARPASTPRASATVATAAAPAAVAATATTKRPWDR
jgi:hypothetical protein